MFVSGMRGEDRVLVKGAARDGLGTHYYWDKQKQLWVEIPNPPKPPPDGTSLSDLPGFAGAITPEGYVRYQWNEAEHEWIPVDDVPLGFTEGVSPKVDRRLEALSLDDYRTRIYWDAERKSWIDLETSMPPKPRPSPPGQYELIGLYRDGEYDEGDMAKVKGEERYFLWSKEKQKWVMLSDPPVGFHRGANPNEAYRKDGSALDRWMVWDNRKEAWVEFGPERRLNIRGRIQ